MAIQVRRGQKADFDPTKMLPGEWAVSIDSDTNNQIVWMCFSAGIVKRMGTWEDFKRQISEATDDIREEYLAEFQAILDQIEELAEQTSANTDTVVTIRDDMVNTYLPQILKSTETATASAKSATNSAESAENSANLSKSYAVGTNGTIRENDVTDNSKYFKEQTESLKVTTETYKNTASQAALSAENSANIATSAKDSALNSSEKAANLVSQAEEIINSGSLVGPQGIQGPQGEKGDTGEKGERGEKGEKGDTGESGITVPVNGFFTLSVDSDGNLWAYSAEDGTTPDFEYDSDTGNLYVVQEVV